MVKINSFMCTIQPSLNSQVFMLSNDTVRKQERMLQKHLYTLHPEVVNYFEKSWWFSLIDQNFPNM